MDFVIYLPNFFKKSKVIGWNFEKHWIHNPFNRAILLIQLAYDAFPLVF